MKNSFCCKSILYIFLLVSLFFSSCNTKNTRNENCIKYQNEEYSNIEIDTSLKNDFLNYHKYLLKEFNEKSIKELPYESYQLLYFTSHGYGKLIRFEKIDSSYSMEVKCIKNPDFFSCNDSLIEITEDEWDQLEEMIYEFNFWTEESFRKPRESLDGYIFLLEGNRPEAEKCNKKTYSLIGRGPFRYDKMSALCWNIVDYQYRLTFYYEQD